MKCQLSNFKCALDGSEFFCELEQFDENKVHFKGSRKRAMMPRSLRSEFLSSKPLVGLQRIRCLIILLKKKSLAGPA